MRKRSPAGISIMPSWANGSLWMSVEATDLLIYVRHSRGGNFFLCSLEVGEIYEGKVTGSPNSARLSALEGGQTGMAKYF